MLKRLLHSLFMPSSKLEKFGIQQVDKGQIATEEDTRELLFPVLVLHQGPGIIELLLHSDEGLTLIIYKLCYAC